ncbi:protein YbgS [Erwinia sp. P7711]|uniref:protein YbgS n=1 Tax=Erwinia sp. P7711 TaxID=3141451 RepID=UPI00319B267C
MMNKFAIVFLTAAMTLGSGAAMAAGGNNGTANQAADAGAAAGSAKENLAPNKVDNSQINNTGDATSGTQQKMDHQKNMTANEIDQNTQCKDGKCPDINKKVGPGADTKTDGTSQ